MHHEGRLKVVLKLQCCIVFDKLQALLLIAVFHSVISTPTRGPSEAKTIWCELSPPRQLHDEHQLVQDFFDKQTVGHLLIVVLRPISTPSTLKLTLSTPRLEMCTWPCPNHFLDPANTLLWGGDFDKAPPYLQEEYTKPLMFFKAPITLLHTFSNNDEIFMLTNHFNWQLS